MTYKAPSLFDVSAAAELLAQCQSHWREADQCLAGLLRMLQGSVPNGDALRGEQRDLHDRLSMHAERQQKMLQQMVCLHQQHAASMVSVAANYFRTCEALAKTAQP